MIENSHAGPPPPGADAPGADDQRIEEERLAELLDRVRDAASAYIRGDIRRYLALFDHPDDYTLMPPYGGETRVGYRPTESDIEQTSRFFANGEATLDVQHTYVFGDLVVLVAVERQHGEVGGLPDQDWSLRVTIVFRRVGDRWQIVHRHADLLSRRSRSPTSPSWLADRNSHWLQPLTRPSPGHGDCSIRGSAERAAAGGPPLAGSRCAGAIRHQRVDAGAGSRG